MPVQERDLVSPVVYRWSVLKRNSTGLREACRPYDLVLVYFRSIVTGKEVPRERKGNRGHLDVICTMFLCTSTPVWMECLEVVRILRHPRRVAFVPYHGNGFENGGIRKKVH